MPTGRGTCAAGPTARPAPAASPMPSLPILDPIAAPVRTPRSITDDAGRELAKCGKGQCFGELALLKNEARCGALGRRSSCATAALQPPLQAARRTSCSPAIGPKLISGLTSVHSQQQGWQAAAHLLTAPSASLPPGLRL